MSLSLEEKLDICQKTIKELQNENEALKEENATLKKSLSFLSEDGEIEVTDYIAQFKDVLNALQKARAESLEELKKTNEEMKKTRQELDRLKNKTKLKLWLSGARKNLEK